MPGPFDISGCKLWLDARRPLGKWTPAKLNPSGWYEAGSISGVADSTALSRWRDLSGNDNHLTQSGSARPLFIRSGLNSRPAVRFDGSNDFMTVTGDAMSLSGTDEAWTFAVLAKVTATGTNQAFLAAGKSDNDQQFAILRSGGSGNFELTIRDNAALNKTHNGGVADTGWHVLIFTTSGTLGNAYRDNLLSGTANQDLDIGACTFDTFSLGGLDRLTDTNFLGGDIAAAIVTPGVITASDRNRLSQYWARAYSVAHAVGIWHDLSGNDYHAVQNTDTLKPIWQPNGLGTGLPSIRFDGTDDYMLAPVPTGSETEATFLGVHNRQTSLTLRGLFSFTDTTNTRLTVHSQNTSADEIDVNTGTGAGTYLEQWATPGTGPMVTGIRVKTAGAISELRGNGTLRDSSSGTPSISLGSGSGWAVGCRVPGSGAQPFIGDLSEMVACNVAWSVADYQRVEAYMRGRWRTT